MGFEYRIVRKVICDKVGCFEDFRIDNWGSFWYHFIVVISNDVSASLNCGLIFQLTD